MELYLKIYLVCYRRVKYGLWETVPRIVVLLNRHFRGKPNYTKALKIKIIDRTASEVDTSTEDG